ncbi:MAG: GNAT family protein [Erythrobacter sp.]
MRTISQIQTRRFTMRALERGDAGAFLPTLSDDAQCLYLTRPAFTSEEELGGWLADPTWTGRSWIAVDDTGVVAGRFVAFPAHEDGVEEIGYIVCADRQGQGVAKECTAALIAHLFETGTRKLTAEVDTRNAASVALLESLGFTREAHFREHETTHAGMCDVYMYGLLKRDRRQA